MAAIAQRARSRRSSWMVVAVLLLGNVGGILVPVRPALAQEPGFSIRHGRLYDANGNDFVLRGINHPHAWFPDQIEALGDIKAAGANAVRVVVSSGHRFQRTEASELSRLIAACKQHLLICVLELHDTTGYLEVDDAISLQQASAYWIEMASTLIGEEAYVILNVGNEPFGNLGHNQWASTTASAISAMRTAGLHHTLMADAPNWGQDWSLAMSRGALDVLESDPDQNVIFDVHMYGVYNNEAKVRAYVEGFVRNRVSLVIGEFGATHTDGDPDQDAIMSWAQAYGLGYLAWSWSGNGAPVAQLNIVDEFDPGLLTTWGRRVVHGTNGLHDTSVEASVFGRVVPPMRTSNPLAAVATAGEERSLLVDRAEAEDGVRNGVRVSLKGAGFSGGGYVNDFSAAGDSLTVTLQVDQAGVYDLHLGYRAQYGDKTQLLYVNGLATTDVRFVANDDFTSVIQPGIRLRAGPNRIMVASDWGWFDLDYIEVRSAPQP